MVSLCGLPSKPKFRSRMASWRGYTNDANAFVVNWALPATIARMSRKLNISRKWQQRAERVIPGGVDSPVRAFRAVGGGPPKIVRGVGAHICDADENEYIDYVGSWGPLILGHVFPSVVKSITT